MYKIVCKLTKVFYTSGTCIWLLSVEYIQNSYSSLTNIIHEQIIFEAIIGLEKLFTIHETTKHTINRLYLTIYDYDHPTNLSIKIINNH